VVAIDFTASNGNPSQSSSLHYIDPAGLAENEYQGCIRAVGEIIETYDTDKKFGVFGFGARVDDHVNHCFALHPDGDVDGVGGIMAAYTSSLATVELSGPTCLAPILGNLRGQLTRNPCTQVLY
jgi:Copine